MDSRKIIEDFFWSYIFRFSPHGPKIKARIKPRLDSECKQFVAFELARMLKQPTEHIYSGSREQLLAEAEKKIQDGVGGCARPSRIRAFRKEMVAVLEVVSKSTQTEFHMNDQSASFLEGIQWKRIAATIRMEGETAVEEVTNLARDAARLHNLLDRLNPVDTGKAAAFFRALGVSLPNNRDNKRAVFSGFLQAAICEPRPDITAWLLSAPYLGDMPNVLLVHNSNKVIPVSLVACTLGSSAYLTCNLTGSELLKRLLAADQSNEPQMFRARKCMAKIRKAQSMTDQQMIDVLVQLCNAYIANDRNVISRLDPEASEIGYELDARGGISEMRRVYEMIPDIRGKRTLEMHWNGIGEWRG